MLLIRQASTSYTSFDKLQQQIVSTSIDRTIITITITITVGWGVLTEQILHFFEIGFDLDSQLFRNREDS